MVAPFVSTAPKPARRGQQAPAARRERLPAFAPFARDPQGGGVGVGQLYEWHYDLLSPPETLWPLVADTERFNHDAAVPAVRVLDKPEEEVQNATRHLLMHRFRIGGLRLVPIEWDEEPFQWVRPHRFGVVRRYRRGPIAELRVVVRLEPTVTGGTHLIYQSWAKPRNPFWYPLVPGQFILSWVAFRNAFLHYDRTAIQHTPVALQLNTRPTLAPGGEARLAAAQRHPALREADPDLLRRLIDLLRRGDAMTLAKMRPYALADGWGVSRRATLETCLQATRAGLLDLRWELICPLCRNAKDARDTLSDLPDRVHCNVCHIDFEMNFEQSVELTFRPNRAVRLIEDEPYCVAGPQTTPHIVLQQLIPPGGQAEFGGMAAGDAPLTLETGRYRVRANALRGGQYVRVVPESSGASPAPVDDASPIPLAAATVRAGEGGVRLHEGELAGEGDGEPVRVDMATYTAMFTDEVAVTPHARLTLENSTADSQLMLLEHLRWSDQAAVAAEVTTSQTFRDLFSREVLRPEQQIEIAQLTIVFTDLRGSSRMYRTMGDAPAFGLVLDHFDVLRAAIAEEDGAIVKNLGDAIMAVFRRPVNAVQAVLRAQKQLAEPPAGTLPLQLKVGVHVGTAIAVNLNDRLDYFGTTVNVAARLATLSTGSDVVISADVAADPEVQALFAQRDLTLSVQPFQADLRGFEGSPYPLVRITQAAMDKVTGNG